MNTPTVRGSSFSHLPAVHTRVASNRAPWGRSRLGLPESPTSQRMMLPSHLMPSAVCTGNPPGKISGCPLYKPKPKVL